MRYTKKILKAVFGKHQDGIEYLKTISKNKGKSPTIFVYDKGSNDFIKWLEKVVDSGLYSEEDFLDNKINAQKPILIQQNKDVGTTLVDKVADARKQNQHLIIASPNKPKPLEYIQDPALILAKIDDFDYEKAMEELQELKEELNS